MKQITVKNAAEAGAALERLGAPREIRAWAMQKKNLPDMMQQAAISGGVVMVLKTARGIELARTL